MRDRKQILQMIKDTRREIRSAGKQNNELARDLIDKDLVIQKLMMKNSVLETSKRDNSHF